MQDAITRSERDDLPSLARSPTLVWAPSLFLHDLKRACHAVLAQATNVTGSRSLTSLSALST